MQDWILTLREAYMATAVTEDDPPRLTDFLRDRGITDQGSIRAVERRYKSANWEGHWHKHHRTSQEVLQTRETQAIQTLTETYAQRREALLLQQFEQVENALPELVSEALARKDFMDDKALVQLIKVLFDSRKDIIHNLNDILNNQKNRGEGGGTDVNHVPGAPVGTNLRLVAVGIAMLEAKERGINPADVIDAEYHEEDVVRLAEAFKSLDEVIADTGDE
jgi:hypothetical protein